MKSQAIKPRRARIKVNVEGGEGVASISGRVSFISPSPSGWHVALVLDAARS
jgi:hypothetical protein